MGVGHLSDTTTCITYGIRELASPRHAPLASIARFRGAGFGVREGGGLMAAAYLLGLCTGGAEKPVPRSIHGKCYLESYGRDHSSRNVKALPGLGGCLNAVKAGGSYCRYKTKIHIRFSGVSLTSTCPGLAIFEISGCGMRGAGRWRPDGRRFFIGTLHRRG